MFCSPRFVVHHNYSLLTLCLLLLKKPFLGRALHLKGQRRQASLIHTKSNERKRSSSLVWIKLALTERSVVSVWPGGTYNWYWQRSSSFFVITYSTHRQFKCEHCGRNYQIITCGKDIVFLHVVACNLYKKIKSIVNFKDSDFFMPFKAFIMISLLLFLNTVYNQSNFALNVIFNRSCSVLDL